MAPKLETREDWHGETALMWAAAQKHPEMISALIAAGADVNAMSTVVKWDRQTTAEPREKWLPSVVHAADVRRSRRLRRMRESSGRCQSQHQSG